MFAYRKRGYPRQTLISHLERASQFSQKDLLEVTEKPKQEKSVLIMTYNPRNRDVIGIIRKYWPLLQTNRTLRKLFQEEPMCAFRRQRNLKDMLVKAKLEYPPSNVGKQIYRVKNTTCPIITCRYCRIMNFDQRTKSSFQQKYYPVRLDCRISCRTVNVIYSITCLKCYSQYVGETKRQIRKRIYEHVRTIDNFGTKGIHNTPVSEHFNIQCKRPARYQFQVLETIRADPLMEDTTNLRRRRELYWILTLRSLEPFCMNVHT
jgi:hypothetical protein